MKRFLLAVLAPISTPAFAGPPTPVLPSLSPYGDVSNTTVIPTGTTTAKKTADVVAPATLFVLSRLANAAQSDNVQVNQPMSIPAWAAATTYYSGEIVTVGGQAIEQDYSTKCVSAGSAPTITASSWFVADNTCLWSAVAKTPTGNAPTVLTATQWTASTTYPAGASVMTYTGYSGATGSAAFTGTVSGTTLTTSALTSGTILIGQVLYGQGVPAGTTITAGSGSTWTISTSLTIGTAETMQTSSVGYYYTNNGAACASAASGNGPTGASPAADNACTWTYKYMMPTHRQNNYALNSYLWAGGAGNLATAISYGSTGTPFNSSGSSYMFMQGATVAAWAGTGTISGTTLTTSAPTLGAPAIGQILTNNGVASGTVITAGSGTSWTVNISQTVASGTIYGSAPARTPARFEFLTDSPLFVVRTFSGSTGAVQSSLRFIVCGPNRDHCQYVSPNHAYPFFGTWTNNVLDFSQVGGRQMREIIVEMSGNDAFGGLDFAPTDTVSPPGGQRPLTIAIVGDSYPAGGGVVTEAWAYPQIAADELGVRGVVNTAIGGCGYSSLSNCYSGTAIYRLFDVFGINGGKGPDLILTANGSNDINTNTPAQVGALQTTYIQAIRANPATANVPIIILGAATHNSGGASYAPAYNTDLAEQAAAAAMNDPKLIYCPWTADPQGPWETGTGHIEAPNGSGNTDWTFSTTSGHNNARGNVNFAARIVKCVRNYLSGLGY